MELSIIEYSILLECSNFLEESNSIPIIKYLPYSYKTQDKVKIRLKSNTEAYHKHLDNILNFKNFANRSLKCYTNIDDNAELCPYYVFLPDGYKFIYTKDNLDINLKSVFEELSKNLKSGAETFEELLKYSYNFDNLYDCHNSNDIIFYNIPYYYCIRANIPYKEATLFYDNIQN